MKDKLNKQLAKLFGVGDRLSNGAAMLYERELKNAYKDSLKNIRGILAEMFEKYGDDIPYVEMQKYNRLANIEKQIVDVLQDLGVQVKKSIRKNIVAQYSQNYYATGYATEKTLQANLGFGVLRKETIEAAIFNPLDAIKWTDRTSKQIAVLNDRIKQQLTRSLIQGEGYSKTARQLTEKIDRSFRDTMRIIRTEGHRAQSAGRLAAFDRSEQAAEDLGVETARMWVSTLDGRTRDEHRSMDGQAAVDGVFTFPDGFTAQAPGLSGVAEHDIHCRCTTILQIAEIPQTARIDETNSVIPYTTYHDWYKARIKKEKVAA